MRFYKVSFEQFKKDYEKCCKESNLIKEIYDEIRLPKRATVDSAGYDFFIPYTVNFKKGEDILVPTGIRFECDDDKYLLCVPRSGLGFKYGCRLKNTCGIIDSGYFYSDNEGHIMAKFTCDSDFTLEKGKAMMQGIISPFYKVDDDDSTAIRNGGFGSTGM